MNNEEETKVLERWVQIYAQFERLFQALYVEKSDCGPKKRKAHIDNATVERINSHNVLHEPMLKWCIILFLDATVSSTDTTENAFMFQRSVARRHFNQHEVLLSCILDDKLKETKQPEIPASVAVEIPKEITYENLPLAGLYMPKPYHYPPHPSFYESTMHGTSYGGSSSSGSSSSSSMEHPGLCLPPSMGLMSQNLSQQMLMMMMMMPTSNQAANIHAGMQQFSQNLASLPFSQQMMMPTSNQPDNIHAGMQQFSQSLASLPFSQQMIMPTLSQPDNINAGMQQSSGKEGSCGGSSSGSSGASGSRKRPMDAMMAVDSMPPPLNVHSSSLPSMPLPMPAPHPMPAAGASAIPTTDMHAPWLPAPWQPMPGHPHPFAGLPLTMFTGYFSDIPPPALKQPAVRKSTKDMSPTHVPFSAWTSFEALEQCVFSLGGNTCSAVRHKEMGEILIGKLKGLVIKDGKLHYVGGDMTATTALPESAAREEEQGLSSSSSSFSSSSSSGGVQYATLPEILRVIIAKAIENSKSHVLPAIVTMPAESRHEELDKNDPSAAAADIQPPPQPIPLPAQAPHAPMPVEPLPLSTSQSAPIAHPFELPRPGFAPATVPGPDGSNGRC